jgi:flavin-dependent dehydrogenase
MCFTSVPSSQILVHRMHLHEGLAEVAKREGAEIFIESRVAEVD